MPRRIRYEFLSLSTFGEAQVPIVIPVRCWRMIINCTSESVNKFLLDGVPLFPDLLVSTIASTSGLALFDIGGHPVLPSGEIIGIHQDLVITGNAGDVRGVICFQHIEEFTPDPE